MTNQPATAAIYGIDIGKTRFDVACLDTTGRPINRLKFRRDTLLKHFSGVAKSVVAMEACPGSQWLARKLQAFGHDVRIIPAQFVKPYVKSNKFDVQALHRARDRLVSTRTRTVSQIRSFCLEYGITMRQGIGVFKLDLPRILSDDANELTPMMRNLLRDLWDEFTQLELRVAKITRQIETLAKMDGVARRLQTIPGIGPLGATALLAAVGNGHQFRRARDLAAWLGLVPRQHSTGGKQVLLGISKRGNSYVRRLLIHGARSAAMHLDKSRDRLGLWIVALRTRMHVNKVIVALANKIARIAWVILNKPGALYERIAPANA
jgi:transposase